MPDGLSGDALMDRMHIDHCIETLRIALQCSADVTAILIRETSHASEVGKADIHTHRRCRNFEKINAWLDENYALPI